MTEQTTAPEKASYATYVKKVTRSRVIVEMRDLFGMGNVTAPDGGESVYVQHGGQTIEITIKNVTDQIN